MKAAQFSLTLIFLGSLIPTSAAVPKKRQHDEYKIFWTNSPFTSKPKDKETPPPQPNPVDDYTLAGVSQVEEGWFVVLLHKKDRSKRIRLHPHEFTEGGFRVLSVENPTTRQVRVEIAVGGQSAWVQYESKFLALRTATPQATQPQGPIHLNNQGPNPALNPKQSRVRRVPIPPKPDADEEQKKTE